MLENMPVSIADDAQRIVDEIAKAQGDMKTITSQDAWLWQLASLVRDLARKVEKISNK